MSLIINILMGDMKLPPLCTWDPLTWSYVG